MSASHPTRWQAQLSQAIVGFPLWGRLKPSSSRGHAITALAFHAWSMGGLGIVAHESEVKSIGKHLHACAFAMPRFEAVIVDWKEGWCKDPWDSSRRWQVDAARGGTVYSNTVGLLLPEGIAKELEALDPQDQVLVKAMEMHLHRQLGAFDWAHWTKTAKQLAPFQKDGRALTFVEPIALASGQYALQNRDPFYARHDWPAGLSGEELCHYLSAYPRPNASIDFCAFQERWNTYLTENPNCIWTNEHSQTLLDRWQNDGWEPSRASHFFHLYDHDKHWPSPCTMVVAPCFSRYLASFVGFAQHAEETCEHPAWLAASHFLADAQAFSMFDGVFGGKELLDASEELVLEKTSFRLEATRGKRGTLLMLDTQQGESAALDALRQARAYCGGILAVDHALVSSHPDFWKTRFERREVAALLGADGTPICAHHHYHYNKTPAEVQYALPHRNAHSNAEHSLFQTQPRMWRGQHGITLECYWGWKQIADTQGQKHHWCPAFPAVGDGSFSWENVDKWREMRTRWLATMEPSDAALVLGNLLGRKDWPIEGNGFSPEKGENDFQVAAERYLVHNRPVLAVCEMMDFEAQGVLAALRQCDSTYAANAMLTVDGDDFSKLMETGP